MEEQTYMDVSPAYAVCRAHYAEQLQTSWFDAQTQAGCDWDDYVQHGKFTVCKGNWCSLTTDTTASEVSNGT